MSAQFHTEKTSVIPGATKVTDDDGNQMFDHKGRPLWNLAKPIKHVTHFKNAGMRRLYENGEITLRQATHQIPVYRGVGIDVARMIRNHKRQQRHKGIIEKGFENVQEGAQQARERIAGMKKRAMAKKGLGASQKAQETRKDPSTLTTAMAAELVDQHGSVRAAATASGFSRDAISRRLARRK